MIDEDGALRARIVVGVDGSPSSIAALRWAAKIARATGCEIDAMICWEYPTTYRPAIFNRSLTEPGIGADVAAMLTEALRKAFGDATPDGLRALVREGYAAKELIDASAHAEMLVLGSRGRGGLTGMLLGSVSTSCARHAACPVVIVRAEIPETPSA